jgi:predicted esterase
MNQAGYIVAAPTSLQGAWGTQATGGTPEGWKKDASYLARTIEVLTKEYNVNPYMVHMIGYSAGSTFSANCVGHMEEFRTIRVHSISCHSGGFTGQPMPARPEKAKETVVRVYNGSNDAAHAQFSRTMCESFRMSGYDAKFIEVPGAGHIFPLEPIANIINWWVEMDKPFRNCGKYAAELKKAQQFLETKEYGKAYKIFQEVLKGTKDKLAEFAQAAETGIKKIEEEGERLLKEAEALRESGRDDAGRALEDVAGLFAGTPAALKAKEALSGMKKPPPAEPPGRKPGAAEKPKEESVKPQEDRDQPRGQVTPESLLEWARRLINSGSFDAAEKILIQLLDEFPDSPLAPQAEKLLDEISGRK